MFRHYKILKIKSYFLQKSYDNLEKLLEVYNSLSKIKIKILTITIFLLIFKWKLCLYTSNGFNQSHISHSFSSLFWIIDTTHFFLGDTYFLVLYNLRIHLRCSTCIPSTTSRISLINIFLVQDVQVFAYGKTRQEDPLIFVFQIYPSMKH